MPSAKEDSTDDVLTVDEAAKLLRIGRNQLYEAIGRGGIPHLRIGRTIRLSRRALARVMGDLSGHDLPRRETLVGDRAELHRERDNDASLP